MSGQLAATVSGLPGVESVARRGDGTGYLRPQDLTVLHLGTSDRWWADAFIGALNLNSRRVAAGSWNVGWGDFLLIGVTGGGAVTLTLPDAVGEGFHLLAVKRRGANLVTVNPQPGQTIEGAASLVLAADGASVILMPDPAASDWILLSSS